MRYKLLALDIDGTLVPEHTNTISPRVHAAIQQAKEQVVVALVSARAWSDQQIIIDALGLHNRYHVIENGTKVLKPQGEIAYTLYLPHTDVLKICDLSQDLCESIGYCVDGRWLHEHPSATDDCVTTLSIIASRKQAETVPTLLRTAGFDLSVTVGNHWSNPDWAVVLISHKDASKGGGLRYLQQTLGISQQETIAIGDGASDVPMLQQAGLKVAMGNGEEVIKKIADVIAAPVSEDGVAGVVEEYVLSLD